MKNRSPVIFLSAGESSGDELASRVVVCLKQLLPQAKFFGLAGEKMRNSGVVSVVDTEKGANVMGFYELITSLPRVFFSYIRIRRWIGINKPDLAILVDYPDFNLRLAKTLKKKRIPVLYFVSPTVWAWRKNRISSVKKYVDKMALLWPFEEGVYRENGYQEAYFVGHPLMEEVNRCLLTEEEKVALKGELGIAKEEKVLAIFPGSREGELKRHLSLVREAYILIKRKRPELRGVVQTSPLFAEKVRNSFCGTDALVSTKNPLHCLQIASIGLLKSGTCNLQAALLGVPFVMFFKASFFSAFIVRHFIRRENFSIVNILKEGSVKELLQENAVPSALANETVKLYEDKRLQDRMKGDFFAIRQLLCKDEPSALQVARMAVNLLEGAGSLQGIAR